VNRFLVFLFSAAIGLAMGFGAWWAFFAPEQHVEPEPGPPSAPRIEEEPRRQREPLVVQTLKQPESQTSAGVAPRWAAKNREAITALEAGDHTRAIELFEECRRAVPEEQVFALNLAEALARSANSELEHGSREGRAAAIERLKRAKELSPEREDIARRLEQVERLERSEEGLWTDTSEHFELSYDGERSEILWSAWQITSELESAYLDLGEHFGHWPVENGRPRIRVVLYKRQGFLEATGIGHWAGGLFDGTVRVPVEDLGREKTELTRVLRHEIVHAFVAVVGGKTVPGWLNEGLAQYLEHKDLGLHQRRIQGAREGLKGKQLLPLEELQKSLASLKDEQKIHSAYQLSLALVDHIERNYGERVLYEMVAGCKAGVEVTISFHKRAGTPLAQAHADLARELE